MSAPARSQAAPIGTTAPTARALAPDLARGVMLLAIAFAHAPLFVIDVERGAPAANAAFEVFHLLFIGNHARPMFAFLFGYGLVQMLNQRTRRGEEWPSVRKMLRRRGWWLIAFGFAHVALLMHLDILAAYGVSALLLVGLLRAKDSTLLWAVGLTLAPSTLVSALGLLGPVQDGVSTFTAGSLAAGTRGAGEMFVGRIASWPVVLIVEVIVLTPAVIFGMWAARRRILEEPERNRGFLSRMALVTLVVSTLGGLPVALIQIDAWSAPVGAMVAAAVAQPFTGYAGGIGMACLVGLAAIRLGRRQGPLTTAVAALGQRSMTMYLAQSVAFIVAFYPWALDLQDDLGLAGAGVVAVVTWLLSVLAADLMRRAGYRGPAENLLRRLVYRRSNAPARRGAAPAG